MIESRPAPRKIAYYCVATHLGGAERSLFDLVSRVEADSIGWYRPFVVLPREDGPLVDKLRECGIPFAVLPMPRGIFGLSRQRPVRSLMLGALAWPALRRYMRRLRALFDAESPDLIHTTGIKCHAVAARLGGEIPVLWHLRDIMTTGPARMLLRRLRTRSHVHVLSNSYATAMAFDSGDENPAVVYNGIDTEVFVPGRDPAFRARFGVGDDVPIVGIVGVLQRGKGLVDFVRMAAMLRQDGVDARYVVVGDEIYDTGRDRGFRGELESLVHELGMDDVFAFVGFRPDSVAVMQGLDLLVSASTHPESFGRVVVEAMACGVPVAASALGGTLELVVDRACGRLFPPGDVGAMAQAVRSLLTDPGLREACVAAGRQRVGERFAIRHYVAGIVRTYDRILGPGQGMPLLGLRSDATDGT